MKKMKAKLGAIGLAAVMTVASVLPVSADTTAYSYAPVGGGSTTFRKYLIMDAGDNVPNATFSFTIEPGAAISESTAANENSVMHVMAGVTVTDNEGDTYPKIEPVIFRQTDNTRTDEGTNIDVSRSNSERDSSDTATTGTDTVQLDAGEKYATQTATISFGPVTFNEPGIYRYIIKETADETHRNAGIIHDTDTDRVLDVYVTDKNDGSGTLQVSSYVLHTDVSQVATGPNKGPAFSEDEIDENGKLITKTDGFTNEYTSKDLKIMKEVSGNEASRDKYFKFTVTVTNVNDNDKYVVSIANDGNAYTSDGDADATSGGKKIGGTIDANANQPNLPTATVNQLPAFTGADLKEGQNFYLQHGQSIVIRGLPLNANYTVTEEAEDYKSTAMTATEEKTNIANRGVIGTVAGANKLAEAGFINTRDGIIPTGIALYAGLGVILVGAAVVLFALTRKNRKVFR